ncbi:MAG: thioredoxin [Chloroflexota bacterium]|nr:thioredoxin [Chloroflexota bacterium]
MSRFDTDNFDVDVIERSREKPVLVDFWAAWCGPCRVIGPVLERLADENGDDWELRKLDTEKHPTIARQYRITSIPAVKLFVDGEVKDEFVGALPEQVIVDWLKKTLPSKFKDQLKRAEALVDDRNFGEAHYLLSAVLENDPDDQDGIALMAQVELYSDPVKAAETADRIPLGSDHFETAEAIKALSRLFQSMETPDVLDEAPVKADYLNAIRLLREGKNEAALEGFIDIIRRNRYYDDDGARKAVIAVFKLLGEDHETTKTYRNPFANALY